MIGFILNVVRFISKLLVNRIQRNIPTIAEIEVEMRDLVWRFDQVIMTERNTKICHVYPVFNLRIEGALEMKMHEGREQGEICFVSELQM